MQTDRGKKWNEIRMRLFKMVLVGVVDDPINQGYDIVSTLMLIVNLIGAFANTFDGVRAQYASLLVLTEEITVAFFALDYALRLVTAKCLYPQLTEGRALAKYMLSAGGIVDLLSFLPFYLPFFFPSGAAAFRLFRVARIFRLFRINAYYDSLNGITEVIVGKKQQLLSSVFIILVLMLGSSLCMYSLEHDAQPEVFKNAFSGVWWSVSTLLTIGYGDIYPITPAGKAMGIFITFLGVGMVAIPTGIISAGFVEQYTRLKRLGDYAEEEELHFIKTELHREGRPAGQSARDHAAQKPRLERRCHQGYRHFPPVVHRYGAAREEADRTLRQARPRRGRHRDPIQQGSAEADDHILKQENGGTDRTSAPPFFTYAREALCRECPAL